MVKTAEDQTMKDEGYKLHAYNILVSNRLPLSRVIPDTRHQLYVIFVNIFGILITKMFLDVKRNNIQKIYLKQV